MLTRKVEDALKLLFDAGADTMSLADVVRSLNDDVVNVDYLYDFVLDLEASEQDNADS